MQYKVKRVYYSIIDVPEEDIEGGAKEYMTECGYDDYEEARADWMEDNIGFYVPIDPGDLEDFEYWEM